MFDDLIFFDNNFILDGLALTVMRLEFICICGYFLHFPVYCNYSC